ncbi:hypothetical protein VR41_11815 [Streptomyces sp. NRRL B-1568]|nr:hypothetical protein VR41_11815 [Streptomyces sp. NRRL B-1568]
MVAALALVVSLGYATKPQWQPWWYAATICDGKLSASDLAKVLPEERLRAGKEVMDVKNGRMRCAVNIDDHHYTLAVEAQSRPEYVQRELDLTFNIAVDPQYVFPQGIPGFRGNYGPTILQECPALGRDSEGRKNLLITTVRGRNTDTSPALRIAVSMANAASTKLGCGAKPLPLPKEALPKELPAVPLKDAVGTACGWLADAPLPQNRSGGPWKVAIPTDDHAPITSCQLMDGKSRTPVAKFSGWYGGWTDKPFETLMRFNVPDVTESDTKGPLMSEEFGRAMARCDGESANFRAGSYPNSGQQGFSSHELQPLLAAFAKDQAKRHGCTDLKLPSEEIHPRSQP